ncbi:MAG: hypothetical protein JXA18_03015 [Chitinispirillaceae bacterium]|nr:hypothetical protein [Chitinispirillaceae bacterium]
MMKYRINLVERIRQQEKQEQVQKSTATLITVLSFVLLFLACTYAASTVLKMRTALEAERRKLDRIEAEYRKYQETRMIVDKADIELLDRLQTGRIFWTKKLAAMAFHLPNRPPNPYWITRFSYNKGVLNVKGYGLISPMQEQLITIDDYLNNLRADTAFSDVFGSCHFNSTVLNDEGGRERVSFDYSAEKKGDKPQ